MTNEELIAKLAKENCELKQYLVDIYDYADDIHGILYCVGGGLNDNFKGYTKDQMFDLFRIAESANLIRHLSKDNDEN